MLQLLSLSLRADLDITQTNIKIESYGYAIADATKAIELDPNYAKVLLLSEFNTQESIAKGCRLITGGQSPILPY